jgi:hypothetical protein
MVLLDLEGKEGRHGEVSLFKLLMDVKEAVANIKKNYHILIVLQVF